MRQDLEEKLTALMRDIEFLIVEERKKPEYSERIDKYSMLKMAESLRKNTLLRESMMKEIYPCSPQWRLLIEMYISENKNKPVSITDAALLSNVPVTTSLRYIDLLEREKVIFRSTDLVDKRRSWLKLTDKGLNFVEKSLRELSEDVRRFL